MAKIFHTLDVCKRIFVAKEFSKHPNDPNNRPFSGKTFRNVHLIPALHKEQNVIIILDGTIGTTLNF